MKFLLDVCASSQALESFLIGLGHDVVSAVAIDPRADDDVLLAQSLAESRALVTVDKDFGELIFVLRQPHGTIIRFVEMSVDNQIAAMQELLDRHADDLLANTLITVSPGRIRVRK